LPLTKSSERVFQTFFFVLNTNFGKCFSKFCWICTRKSSKKSVPNFLFKGKIKMLGGKKVQGERIFRYGYISAVKICMIQWAGPLHIYFRFFFVDNICFRMWFFVSLLFAVHYSQFTLKNIQLEDIKW
jgi:hypothetical protein